MSSKGGVENPVNCPWGNGEANDNSLRISSAGLVVCRCCSVVVAVAIAFAVVVVVVVSKRNRTEGAERAGGDTHVVHVPIRVK